jgi:transcriptional regulator with XRE-family HTH domain
LANGHIEPPDGDDVQGRVRGRLRALRAERGLTLADVAGAAGMDASTLSRLESGARRLTLDHLPPLSRALGVRADDLLAAPRTEDPRVRSTARTRDGMTVWPLNRHPDGSGQHAFKIRPSANRREPMPRTHEGHEWLYVLSGRLRLVLGDHDFVLQPGEAAEFSRTGWASTSPPKSSRSSDRRASGCTCCPNRASPGPRLTKPESGPTRAACAYVREGPFPDVTGASPPPDNGGIWVNADETAAWDEHRPSRPMMSAFRNRRRERA